MQNLEPIIAVLRARVPGLLAVYLYGSSARGEATPDSDLDVAFLGRETLQPLELFELRTACAIAAKVEVDLVQLGFRDPVLTAEVLDCGPAIYEADADAVAEWETTAMSMYCAYNEEMKEIIAGIMERGSVYAR